MESTNFSVIVESFGFKYGIPEDADLVFDVRFLPNPYYVDELRDHTGNEKEVQEYVMKSGEGEIFLQKLVDMLEFLLPQYVQSAKEKLTIAIGCTGGQHRSVTIANKLYERISTKDNYEISLAHRNISR